MKMRFVKIHGTFIALRLLKRYRSLKHRIYLYEKRNKRIADYTDGNYKIPLPAYVNYCNKQYALWDKITECKKQIHDIKQLTGAYIDSYKDSKKA